MDKRQPDLSNILIKINGEVLKPGRLIQSKGRTMSRRMFHEPIYEIVKDEPGGIFLYLGYSAVHDNLYDILLLDHNGIKQNVQFGLFEISDNNTIDIGAYFLFPRQTIT